MALLQKLFGRICMDEMGDGTGGGGGSVDSGSSPSASESPSSSDTGGSSSEPASDDGPSTMLEAIERSLEKKEEPAGDGNPQAKKQDADPNAKPQAGDQKPVQKEQAGEEDIHKMPEGLAPRAQERFRKLSEQVKETSKHLATIGEVNQQLQTQLQEATAVRDSFREFVTSTGTNPQQLNEVAAYLKASNSGDVQTEINILMSRLREIQMETGRPIDGFAEMADPLQAFPDLAQQVAGYQITRETAMELARARMMQQNMQQQTQAQTQRQSEVQGWMNGKTSAETSLKNWERQMAASDPDYAQIAPLVMGNAEAMKNIVQNQPPSTWQTHIAMLYNQTKAALQKFRPPQGSSPRPLSGSGGKPTGTAPKAQTMFEAMFPNG